MKNNRIIVCVIAILMAVSFAFNTVAVPEESTDEELVKKGMACLEKKEYKEALEYFTQAVKYGDAEAEAQIGRLYFNGWGVETNYVEALKWTRKAIEQNSATAQNTMGGCYVFGAGVEKDYKEAV